MGTSNDSVCFIFLQKLRMPRMMTRRRTTQPPTLWQTCWRLDAAIWLHTLVYSFLLTFLADPLRIYEYIHCVSIKIILLTFDHNVGRSRPIYKTPSLSDSSSHLRHVSTLPCETWKLQLLRISITYCMQDLRIHLARYEAALIGQDWIIWL